MLRAVFELSREVRQIEVGLLSRELGMRPLRVGEALLELDKLGLVRLDQLRLTMPGLLCASRLPQLQQAERVAAQAPVVVPMAAARVARGSVPPPERRAVAVRRRAGQRAGA